MVNYNNITNQVDFGSRKMIEFLQDYTLLYSTISFCHGVRVGQTMFSSANIVQIHRLVTKTLDQPLDVIVERDGDGYLARNPDLPLYGYGDDRLEAIEMLRREIESLDEELTQDDNYTQDWLELRNFLSQRIRGS